MRPPSRIVSYVLAIFGFVFGAVAPASAGVIGFDNPAGPGHFNWSAGANVAPVPLDIKLPAAAQPSAGPTSFNHLIFPEGGQLSGPAIWGNGSQVIGLDAATLIGPALAGGVWLPGAITASKGGSAMPEGVPTYVAVRFNPGDGDHYGWIGVVRTFASLDAFGWGYETLPNTAIEAGATPEPGSLALLAIGSAGVLARHRRRS